LSLEAVRSGLVNNPLPIRNVRRSTARSSDAVEDPEKLIARLSELNERALSVGVDVELLGAEKSHVAVAVERTLNEQIGSHE